MVNDTPQALNAFIQLYQSLGVDELERILEVYDDAVVFQDPLHRVDGSAALLAYFENLYTNLSYCHFDIKSTLHSDTAAMVSWQMRFVHPKLNAGQEVAVDGVSELAFSGDKVISHRDYFDVGQMLYEHIWGVGAVIRAIKKRASA
ncbi:MAG: nuclear transport factor 2 family protein [Gammaproteobacteria bacterium]|nr:nuclear transport factor 2 family protein [Gammaproteobacteria bacterium]